MVTNTPSMRHSDRVQSCVTNSHYRQFNLVYRREEGGRKRGWIDGSIWSGWQIWGRKANQGIIYIKDKTPKFNIIRGILNCLRNAKNPYAGVAEQISLFVCNCFEVLDYLNWKPINFLIFSMWCVYFLAPSKKLRRHSSWNWNWIRNGNFRSNRQFKICVWRNQYANGGKGNAYQPAMPWKYSFFPSSSSCCLLLISMEMTAAMATMMQTHSTSKWHI